MVLFDVFVVLIMDSKIESRTRGREPRVEVKIFIDDLV